MVVYIEYAIFQNAICDAALLYLTLAITKQNLVVWRIVLATAFGTAFAIFAPFLRLPNWAFHILKFAVGATMCLLAVQRIKTKKEWGRYALSLLFFFAVTFFFGGAILGIYGGFSLATTPEHGYIVQDASGLVVTFAFAVLCVLTILLVKTLYRKQSMHRFVYPCRLYFCEKSVVAQGFLDSGNLALHNQTPVCFLSPDCFFDLCGDGILQNAVGLVRDEMQIQTLTGKKKQSVYLGEIEVEIRKNKWTKFKAYFALSRNMIAREYKVLLNGAFTDGRAFEGVEQ